MSQTVAIVGAGLLGRLLAWRLLLQGHHVSLFEASQYDQPRSAAHTAAAMISPFSEAVVSNKNIFAIGMHSLALWPQWVEALNTSSALRVNFANPGTLAIAHPQDAAELRQLKQDLQGILGHQDTSQWMEGMEIQSKEPSLYQFQSALYLPGEAYLDNRLLLTSLLQRIRELGGKCRENTAINLVDNKEFSEQFDLIIDCRGVGAKERIEQLRGVRGEVMWVHCPEVSINHAVRLMHPRYKLYLVPKPNNHYILGATEIESEDLSPISVQSMMELGSALYTIHPAFAEARVVETDVNLRPALLDNEPKISIEDNLISINGLHRHGYLLAPTMIDDVVRWINQQSTSQFWSYFTKQVIDN